MIKLTVKQLVNAATSGPQGSSALARFFALEKPVAIAWKNRGQIKACEDEVKLYEERRKALVEKYGTKNEETGQYRLEGEKLKIFSAELDELGEQPVEIPGDPIKLGDLGAGCRLSDADASLIEMFLTD